MENEFTANLMATPFGRLVEYIYWDNQGDACIDIPIEDWTMGMVIETIVESHDDMAEFAESYCLFLNETI